MQSRTMRLEDGRTLSWAEIGAMSGPEVLVANHGTGSSRLEMAIYDELLATRGLRVVAPDRPGYGESSGFGRARCVSDWATDVEQLVDALGIDAFAVSGYSGGGPHALAIASALGARVTHVVLVASLAPEQELRSAIDIELKERAATMPWPEFERVFESGLMDELANVSPADEQAFADSAYVEAAMATITEGARQGAAGDAGDQWAFATPWGVEPESVTQPVDIWHGDADTIVPLEHAHTLHERLPNATLHVLPGEGHFSVGRYVPDQLSMLARDA